MATEEQVQTFKYKMRELMSAYNDVHRHWPENVFEPEFQERYARLLREETEGEKLYQEIIGKPAPVNFIAECDEHMLLEPWCRRILQ